jgi:hypothetical protein
MSSRSGRPDVFQTILLAVIISIGPTIAAIAALLAALKNRKQIEEVHLLINSRMNELLSKSRDASFAEGREEGRTGQERHVEDATLATAQAVAVEILAVAKALAVKKVADARALAVKKVATPSPKPKTNPKSPPIPKS